MGYFVDLQAGEGWLRSVTTLDPISKAEAEDAADLWIRQHFGAWNTRAWSPNNQPAEVEASALLVASAEYLDRRKIAADSDAKEDTRFKSLMRRAEGLAKDAAGRKFLLLPDGSEEHPIEVPSSHSLRWSR